MCWRCLILSTSVVSVRSFAVDQRLKMYQEHLLEVKSLHKASYTSIHHIFSRYSQRKDRPPINCRGFGVRYQSLNESTCAICLCRVYLTSTAVDNRCQGTRLLSEVLTHLHSHTLPQDDSELHNMLTKLGLIACQ